MTADPQLDTLESKGLIRLVAYQPELEYLFRHWLVQDAAYGSLLKQERRELHRRVGEALEELYPERVGELAAVLGMHFEQAGDTDRAIEYLVAAGRYALERNAITEAYSSYDRAAALLPAAAADDDPGSRRRRVEVMLGRTRASWSFRPGEELIVDMDAIAPSAEATGDPAVIAQVHLFLAMTRLTLGEPASAPEVKRSLDRVSQIADETDNPGLRAMPLALVGLTKVFTGPIREGVAALEEAVPLLVRHDDFIGAAFARGSLAIGYANLGEFAKADAAAANAVELAKSGDLIAQLDAQIAASWVHAAQGRLDEAMPIALDCVGRAEASGATACVMASSWILGDVLHRQGKFDEARQILQHGSDIALVVDRTGWRPTLQAWLGSSIAAVGAGADGDWDEGLATVRAVGNRFGEAGILAKRGEARLRSGDADAGLEDMTAGLAIFESEGSRPNVARLLQAMATAYRAAGRADDATAALRRSLALFEEMGLDAEAATVRLSLAVPEIRLGA
jgi:tetratricopeptide (TPR) repeat protein